MAAKPILLGLVDDRKDGRGSPEQRVVEERRLADLDRRRGGPIRECATALNSSRQPKSRLRRHRPVSTTLPFERISAKLACGAVRLAPRTTPSPASSAGRSTRRTTSFDSLTASRASPRLVRTSSVTRDAAGVSFHSAHTRQPILAIRRISRIVNRCVYGRPRTGRL